MAASSRSAPRPYREAQPHPNTYYSALNCAVNAHSVPVGKTEVAVVLTGGTPEAVVAALASNYQNVLVVCGDKTELWMYDLPTLASEREHKIDYFQYLSPNPI